MGGIRNICWCCLKPTTRPTAVCWACSKLAIHETKRHRYAPKPPGWDEHVELLAADAEREIELRPERTLRAAQKRGRVAHAQATPQMSNGVATDGSDMPETGHLGPPSNAPAQSDTRGGAGGEPDRRTSPTDVLRWDDLQEDGLDERG